ncbi:MAG: hypothetical protein ACREIC_18970, partial [Limisphaerales bacterium]
LNSEAPIFPKAFHLDHAQLRYRFATMQRHAKLQPWSFYMLRITLFKKMQLRCLPVMSMRQFLATRSQK